MSLVPPPEMLFDGTVDQQAFIDGGPGFIGNLLVARAGLNPDSHVLDIGSGNGKHARILAELLSPNGKYDGFDVLPDAVKWCQKAYAKFPHVEFKLAEVHSDWYLPDCDVRPENYVFPYGDAGFDVAFGSSLFTHLEPAAVQNYLKQTFRVLKPGGRLMMTCFLLAEGSQQTMDVQSRRFQPSSAIHSVIDPEFPSRGVAYHEDVMRRMLQLAGFVVAEITFGKWANEIDALSALQDSILAIKPPAAV